MSGYDLEEIKVMYDNGEGLKVLCKIKNPLTKNKNYDKICDKFKGETDKHKGTLTDMFELKIPLDLGIGEDLFAINNQETYDIFLKELKRVKPDKVKLELVNVEKYTPYKKLQLDEKMNKILEHSLTKLKRDITEKLKLADLEDAEAYYSSSKSMHESNYEDKKKNVVHKGIICNNCLNAKEDEISPDLFGRRFICVECENYNLCQDCEEKRFKENFHDLNHLMIMVNEPTEIDSNSLKVKIQPNYNKLIKENTKNMALQEVLIYNNGSIPIPKGCYFASVRFGKQYLICKKGKGIEEEIKPNEKVSTFLNIVIAGKKEGNYQALLRLFTPEGIPFGNLVKLDISIISKK